MLKDVLLTLPSYPDTVSRAAIRRSIRAARLMDAHVTCLVSEPAMPMPVILRAGSEMGHQAMQARQRQVHEAAAAQRAVFGEEAREAGVAHEARIVTSPLEDGREAFVGAARLHGLTVVPFLAEDGGRSADFVQELVFESGRPVLALPDDGSESFALGEVVVAWDGGRAATRALGDAMPLLRRAGKVRVVTVDGRRRLPDETAGGALVAHLARCGVTATFEDVARGAGSDGEALEAAAKSADLMVMGAFGHSRIRDFFLGGATRHVLAAPKLPTLLSH